MEVVIRKEQYVHVRMCTQNRRAGVVAGCKSVILPDEYLTSCPLTESVCLLRISTVVHDNEPIRIPDPGNLLPDESLRTVILTIIDYDDT
jgi:hypothetical protein